VTLKRRAWQAKGAKSRGNGVGGVIADNERPRVERASNRFEGMKLSFGCFEIGARDSVHGSVSMLEGCGGTMDRNHEDIARGQ
jgi:hypothetical protein